MRFFRNWLSLAGVVVALGSLFAFFRHFFRARFDFFFLHFLRAAARRPVIVGPGDEAGGVGAAT